MLMCYSREAPLALQLKSRRRLVSAPYISTLSISDLKDFITSAVEVECLCDVPTIKYLSLSLETFTQSHSS